MLGPISVHPEQLFLGFINTGGVIQRDILLLKMGPADMKILEVNHQSAFVSTEVAPVESGRQVRIRVTLSDSIPTGGFRDTLEIRMNDKERNNKDEKVCICRNSWSSISLRKRVIPDAGLPNHVYLCGWT